MEVTEISWFIAYSQRHENYGSSNNIDAAPNENNLIGFAKRPGRRAHKKRKFLCHKSVRGYVKLISLGRQTDHWYDVSLAKTLIWFCGGAELNKEIGIVNHDEDGNIDDDVQDDPIPSNLPVKAVFRVNLRQKQKTKWRNC